MTDDRDTPERNLEDVIRVGGLELFSDEVREEVEVLLAAGQALEPATRTRLSEAADRGIQHLRLDRHPIEFGLFRCRKDKQIDLSILAVQTGLAIDVLRAVERGEQQIVDLAADVVAAWIDGVQMEPAIVPPALRRSLAASAGVRSYSGVSDPLLSDEHEAFLREVLEALERRRNPEK